VVVVLSLTVAHGGGVVVVDDGLLWRKTIVTVVFSFCAKAHISSFSFFFVVFLSILLPLYFRGLSLSIFLFFPSFSFLYFPMFFLLCFSLLFFFLSPILSFFLKIKKNLCFLSFLLSRSFLCFLPKIYLPFLPLYCRLPSPFIFCVSPPLVFIREKGGESHPTLTSYGAGGARTTLPMSSNRDRVRWLGRPLCSRLKATRKA
jgi:hypothetical protein